MKNVYVMLPLVEAPDANSVNRKELYPEVGRYIVHLPNDDVFVTEVYGMPEGQEYVNCGSICLGQPRLVPEEELVLAGEVETVRERLEADACDLKAQLEASEKRREEDLAIAEEHYQQQLDMLKEAHRQEMDAFRASEKERLEQEYLIKVMQLEQEVPKRFAQGEWVSGRTLKDIIALLTKDNP